VTGSAAAPERRQSGARERGASSAGGDERKLATVVFADLASSTELAGAEDPERVRALLERFYDAMAAEVETAGGTVEKFAGDAVMAAFGAPDALEDHAERALHAALAMQRRLTELFGERLALRIGVNTGEVVVGRPREGSSFVTGDPVNVAARLEQAAAPGEILVGERTVAFVRGAFEFDEPTVVEAKGKPGGVACRRLGRALSLMRPRGVGSLQTAFVGREHELETLGEAYRRIVAEGRPHLVTVLGEAGVGKTRLAREFWTWLATEAPAPEPLRRTGRCLHYGHGITYWALGEILKEHFEVLESDEPESVLRRLAGREILGLTLGLDVAGDRHPLVARDRLHEAWVTLADELTAARPTVVLVEDLHWAEDELLDLLELLLRAVNGPLLLVATARPELLDQRPGWGGARRAATTIELEPLSAVDTGRMLNDLLASELPEHVREVIVERGEGNPFFVEELLATLIDRGILARKNGSWTADKLPPDFAVPDTIQAVLAARIDLLPAAEKAALQAASVIGRVFWPGPVYELVPEVAPDFRVLEERDFVRRRGGSSIPGETEFVFKHQLTREVAYGSLPKARRAPLHGAFAGWLERFGAGRDEHAPLLAHHYAEAVRPEDADLAWASAPDELESLRQHAVAWLRRAADLALGRYEIPETLALLDRALALAGDDRTKIEILQRVARAHEFNYDMEPFHRALEEALALAPEREVAADIYADLAHYGHGRAYMWKEPPPAELSERWLATAQELAEPGSEARGFALLARALAEPETEAGVEAAAEALAVGEALAHPRLVLHACEAQTLVASAAGRFEEACAWADRARRAQVAESDPGWRAHQYFLSGFVYLRAARIAEVPRFAAEFDRLVLQLTPHDEMHAVALHAVLASTRGRWQELRELRDRAEAASAANTETPCQFNWRSLLVCALGLAQLGDERQARELEERARAGALVAGPAEREPALLRLALLRGDLAEAERILERLPTEVDPWGLDAAAARLDALVALGDRARVEAEAAPYLESASYTHPFALRSLGIVQGRRDLVEQALAAFAAQGLDQHVSETHDLLKA
jgi:class 3 adenylate cyclase